MKNSTDRSEICLPLSVCHTMKSVATFDMVMDGYAASSEDETRQRRNVQTEAEELWSMAGVAW
jgi:hypothetical protein